MSLAPVVVFAIGNPSRGDDAIGPQLFARLTAWLEEEGLSGQFELFEDFQLQIEHALDLKGRRLALFIDAGDNTPGPFVFQHIHPSTASSHTSHALAPQAVLQVYRQIEGCEAPPAFVLCVRGEGFKLGEPLSSNAEVSLSEAFQTLQQLCRQPALDDWLKRAQADSPRC